MIQKLLLFTLALLIAVPVFGDDPPRPTEPWNAKIITASGKHGSVTNVQQGILSMLYDSSETGNANRLDTFYSGAFPTLNAKIFQAVFSIDAVDSEFACDSFRIYAVTSMDGKVPALQAKRKMIWQDSGAVAAPGTITYKYKSIISNDTLLWPQTYFEVQIHDSTDGGWAVRSGAGHKKSGKYKVEILTQVK